MYIRSHLAQYLEKTIGGVSRLGPKSHATTAAQPGFTAGPTCRWRPRRRALSPQQLAPALAQQARPALSIGRPLEAGGAAPLSRAPRRRGTTAAREGARPTTGAAPGGVTSCARAVGGPGRTYQITSAAAATTAEPRTRMQPPGRRRRLRRPCRRRRLRLRTTAARAHRRAPHPPRNRRRPAEDGARVLHIRAPGRTRGRRAGGGAGPV